MPRSFGLAGRGLRIGVSRPGFVVAAPPTAGLPQLATETGDVVVTESGAAITTETA